MALFSCVVPGCPLITDFPMVSEAKWSAAIGTAPESIVLFLTGVELLPPNTALAAYMARADQQEFTYVGFISNELPSAIMKVPTALLEPQKVVDLLIGISLEPMDVVANLAETTGQAHAQFRAATHYQIASKIAQDLLAFVNSFAKMVPKSVFHSLFASKRFPPFPGVSSPGFGGGFVGNYPQQQQMMASFGVGADDDGAEELVVMPGSWMAHWKRRIDTKMAKDVTFWRSSDD